MRAALAKCRITALGFAVALGTSASAEEAAPRVLSLGGSITEIVVALGEESRLVARDTTSTYPQSVQSLPDVGYLRALSPEGVLSVAPDLVLADADAGPPTAIEVLKAAGVAFYTMPNAFTPAGVVARIEAVAAALGRDAEGARLAATVRADLDRALSRAAALASRKRVLFVLSVQGGRVMAGGQGSAAEGIIALAGGENAAQGFDGYKPMTDEAIITAAPDVILMMAREGDLAIGDDDLLTQPALAQTPAAQNGAIVRMDGMFLLGFGPRTAAAADALYAAIYAAEP